jgi:DNA polymerase III delta prime subunit
MSHQEHIWAQKYRPKTLSEIILPESIVTEFQNYIKDGKIPHLLLASRLPGTGKTTLALAICNDLGASPLVINASLNNSIDDIRANVLQYATGVSVMGGPKVVVLDEAERLSQAAQEALKGILESVSKNCVFILTTNNPQRIIEPLRDRCTLKEFVWSAEDTKAMATKMMRRCAEILKLEEVAFKPAVLAAIIKKHFPSNRRILNVLQEYSNQFDKNIDEGILGKLNIGDVEGLVTALSVKDFSAAKDWCMTNSDQLSDGIYLKLFETLQEKMHPQSVPQLILTLGDFQRHHHTVPDLFIHSLALMTTIMADCSFK